MSRSTTDPLSSMALQYVDLRVWFRRARKGVISPLLANLYMRRCILGWKKFGHERRLGAHRVSSVDDFVICCGGSLQKRWP